MKSSFKYTLNSTLFLLLISMASCRDELPETATIFLTLEHEMYGNPVQLDEKYPVVDDKLLSFDKFRYYLSNIKVRNTDTGEFIEEAESYHLVSVTDESVTFEIKLEGVESNAYNAIEFGLGVDSLRNHSTVQVGDLDPTNEMVWNWNTGYKFLLIEGEIYSGSDDKPLVYHIGTDANYKAIELPFDENTFPYFYADRAEPLYITISVELSSIFNAPNRLDVYEENHITFDPDESSKVMENFAEGVFEIKNIEQRER